MKHTEENQVGSRKKNVQSVDLNVKSKSFQYAKCHNSTFPFLLRD